MYLITAPGEEPVLTYFYSMDNYLEGMVVYDLKNEVYYDGSTWKNIVADADPFNATV
jgi:hypothetical protein